MVTGRSRAWFTAGHARAPLHLAQGTRARHARVQPTAPCSETGKPELEPKPKKWSESLAEVGSAIANVRAEVPGCLPSGAAPRRPSAADRSSCWSSPALTGPPQPARHWHAGPWAATWSRSPPCRCSGARAHAT
eukprot:1640076-Rhodomonas_salina.2